MKCPYCNHSIVILDINAVARLRNVTPRMALRWCESGKLKAQKVGDKWLILKSDLDKFIPQKVGRPKSLR